MQKSMSAMNRRGFGRLAGSTALAAAFASVGRPTFAADNVRLIWWGNPERDKRTYAVVDKYNAD